MGKLGVGKDKEGKDLEINEAQDEENWKKASTWEKVQSAPARGVEKVASFLGLDNIARQARSDRIQKETEYLKNKEATVQTEKQLTTETNQKRVDNKSGTEPVSAKEYMIDSRQIPAPEKKEGFFESAANKIKSFFGMGKPTVEPTTEQPVAAPAASSGSKLQQLQAQRDKIAKAGPATDSAHSIMNHRNRLAAYDKAIEKEKANPSTPVETTTKAAPASTNLEKVAPGSYTPSAPTSKGGKKEILREKATQLGIDPNNAEGKYEGGVLTKVVDTNTGKEYSVEVSGEDKRKVDAVRSLKAGNESPRSLENAAISGDNGVPKSLPPTVKEATPDSSAKQTAAEIGKNIVVQAPAPVVVNGGGGGGSQSVASPPFTSNLRNNEPSISDYLRRRYAF